MSCRQLVDYYLDNIERQQSLNAFLEVWADEARAQAAAVDAKLAAGTAGPLAGMVIGLKDVLAYAGHALFQAKLAVIAGAGVNALVLQRAGGVRARPGAMRAAACASLGLWVAAMGLGRWIAYG